MAPKRRTTGPVTKSQQSTLAFHGSSNKVTKSGVKAQGAKKNLLEKKLKDATSEILEISGAEPTRTEAAIIEQTEQEVQAQQVESTPEEDRARRISDGAIKKYWAAKEKQRRAPRAHQGGLRLHDKILREFDMSAHYGPCTGIARLKRWKRAQRLDLDPPIEVLAVLLREQDVGDKDKISLQRSVVDEILNTKAELDVREQA
ncbi:dna polymerase delta subunit 4 [Stemphylium lycopersici]|uniref:Dna polymerase delta subunit 4 n=1 Tax=Stemphylium lycopersici TaxID=183478 RepID=A0A364NDP2_STELY|nr:dna polymerase delta subunit 4 [Stemphylium lycopersici]RAR10420.1 dna polymerase delta subunit 4 [Stemphylium lycopersici]RAR15211.1 dna polymerase delta subunit 4 [Stemphylium lycopersici]